MRLLVRWAIIVVALIAAVLIVPGIYITDTQAWIAYSVMAVILGLVNAIIRPILRLLSCGCIVMTLGLFLLVINAFTLWFSSLVAKWIGVGFVVKDFWAALFGSIIVSVVSFFLSIFLVDD